MKYPAGKVYFYCARAQSITQFKHWGTDNDIHLLESLERDDSGMALGSKACGDERVEASVGRGR